MTLNALYEPFRDSLVAERDRRAETNERNHAAVSIAINQTIQGLDQLLKVLNEHPIESKDEA